MRESSRDGDEKSLGVILLKNSPFTWASRRVGRRCCFLAYWNSRTPTGVNVRGEFFLKKMLDFWPGLCSGTMRPTRPSGKPCRSTCRTPRINPSGLPLFRALFERAGHCRPGANFHYTTPPQFCQFAKATKNKTIKIPNLCILPVDK